MTVIEKESLQEIIESQVLSGVIHSLLKDYKDDNKEEIRLSGTKTEMTENLLSAIEKKIIPLSKVYQVIRESEEYGDQYIFVFKCLNNATKDTCSDGEEIADKILPIGERDKFPKLMKLPDSLEWVDFRSPNRGVANSWLVKLYDKKVREIKENEEINYTNGTRTVTYRKKESRLIYIVYWNGVDELEIKISRTSFDSHKNLDNSIKLVRSLIAKGVSLEKGFKLLDLTEVINNFLNNSQKNKNIYNLQNTKLIDSQGGTATVNTYGDDESDLLSDDSRKDAIDAYLEKGGSATAVAITFLKEGSNNILSKDVNVILGRDTINQIIIPSNITPQEYNYVRRKITDFS